MANEEMRRLKIALQEVQEQQAQAVAGQQIAAAPAGTGAPTPPEDKPDTTTTTTYKWKVQAERYREVDVENDQVVVFRGVNGIQVSQLGRRITIAQNVLSWIGRADAGTMNVRNEGIVRIRGVNGVTTRAFSGNPLSTLEIDRPLRIYQRGIQIGDAGTVGINFHNHSNHLNKNEHNQVHFQIQDEGNGVRRVLGWAKKGDTSVSLEGALSTVWIKDAEQDIATAIGYNILTNQYVEQLFIGPWGWQNGLNSTVPYGASGYSNNAKDTQWDWGWSGRFSPMSAYTRFGKVSKAGLYLISGTTQGMRYITSAVSTVPGAPHINLRLHYHLLVRRYAPEVGYYTGIYKTLDVCPWDLWGLNVGDAEERLLFVQTMSSVPWSLQGTAQIWLEPDDEVAHLISFNYGNNGETRIAFETTYHAFEAILVADETTLDPATQVDLSPININEPPVSYHNMQFINV